MEKKAVEIAIQMEDYDILHEILTIEKSCHNESRDGVGCFRQVVKTDERSTKAVERLDSMYEQTWASKYIMPLFVVIPLCLRIVNIIYDQASDIQLAVSYHGKHDCISNCIDPSNVRNFCFTNGTGTHPNSSYRFAGKQRDSLLEERLTPDDYYFAKFYTLFSVCMMLLFNLPMTYIKVMRWSGNEGDKCSLHVTYIYCILHISL